MSLFTSMALRQSPFVASLARSYASASKKIAFQKPQANAISRIRTKQPTAKSAAAAKKSAAAAETPAAAKVGPTPLNMAYSSPENQLAKLGVETVLYKFKPTGFIAAAYVISAGMFAYAANTLDLRLNNDRGHPAGKEMPRWIQNSTMIGVVLGTVLGLTAAWYPSR